MNFGEKKLGFGLMRLPLNNPNDQADINLEETIKMVDLFMENGFSYFDTAWMYCDFNSENIARQALVERYPRNEFTLADKLHSGFFDSYEQRDKVFSDQLGKTGVDFFDFYLLHDVGKDSLEKYEKYDCFGWMKQLKEQGRIKHYGFSFHDTADLLDKILTDHPDVEFVQLQINYLDWDSPSIQSKECLEVAKKHGKPVIVMEPVKGGTLAKIPEKAENFYKAYNKDLSIPSWAVRFAASQDGVVMVLSGMSNLEQMEDNVSYMKDFKPLSTEEEEIVLGAREIINENIAIACTACCYCIDANGCPMNIPIPRFFNLYNLEQQESEEKGWHPQGEYYDRLVQSGEFGKASDCIECGHCEHVCPQHLTVIAYMKDVAECFDK